MSPVPSACQPLADQVAALEHAYATLAAQAQAMVGQPAWIALGQLGVLLRELTAARSELAQCIATHSAALTGNLIVIDASGTPLSGTQTVTLWDLAAGGPAAREIAQVQAGAFGFQGPLPAQAAMSVQTAGAPDVTGLDFRSGILPGPLAGHTPRVEIVLGPMLAIPAKSLTDWATTVQIPLYVIPAVSGLNQAATSLDVTVVSLSAAPAADVITITANGIVSGGMLGGSTPWSAAISVALVPANAPHVDDIVAVTLVGANPIQVSLAPGAGVLGSLAAMLAPFIGPVVQDALNTWANKALSDGVALGFALGSLPPAARVSLRKIKLDAAGITFQPAVGLIGTTLSSFQPSPLPLPPNV